MSTDTFKTASTGTSAAGSDDDLAIRIRRLEDRVLISERVVTWHGPRARSDALGQAAIRFAA